MLSLLWPLCLSPLFKQTWFSASRSYLNQLVAYSLLEHLQIVYLNISDPFESWKRITSTARNFFKRRVGKTYHFWMETYLVWKAGGGGGAVARALTKKIDPG